MAYPNVRVTNSTDYTCTGTVEYASFFCRNDDYTVEHDATWEGPPRGVCLVTKISAVVQTPNGNILATPYTSSGTSYSKFAIIVGERQNEFTVTRITTEQEEFTLTDYVEPTEQQK